jgi:hypothetical protein
MLGLYNFYSVAHDFTSYESDMFQYPVIPLSKSRLYAGIAHAACYRINLPLRALQVQRADTAFWLAPLSARRCPPISRGSRGFSLRLLNLSKALLQNR